jgi:shikimate kinase
VVNLSAHKEFALTNAWSHEVKLQIRADASNAFNHASFGVPNGVLTGATTAGTNYTGVNGNGPQITSITEGGRNVQLGARLTF